MKRKRGQHFTLGCIPVGALVEYVRSSPVTGDCMVRFVNDTHNQNGPGAYKAGDLIQVKPHELRPLGVSKPC